MNEMIQDNYIDLINHFINTDQTPISEECISCLGMGKIIYYYTYSRYTKDKSLEEQADILLDEILDKAFDLPVCLEDGILGLGCGIIYLLRNGFIGGDEDDILGDIDRLYWVSLKKGNIDGYGWLCYLRHRILCNRNENNRVYGLILKQHALSILDTLYEDKLKGLLLTRDMLREVLNYHNMKLSPSRTATLLGVETMCEKFVDMRCIENRRIDFVIPVRIDSVERERNLDVLLAILTKMDNVRVLIMEGDLYSKYKLKIPYENVMYFFVEDLDPIFHRTKYLNCLLNEAQAPIVGIWDTDVIVSERQIECAINKIREGKAAMAFPYDGHFYALPQRESLMFVQNYSFIYLNEQIDEKLLEYGPHSVGGAFLVNREIYLKAGGENEFFYGWGPEDAERVKRLQILGLPIFRAEGPLFHLYHPRKENSKFCNINVEAQNRKELLNVCGMTRTELIQYIQTWPWKK